MKSRTPQLSLEYRYYKSLGPHCKSHKESINLHLSSEPGLLVVYNSLYLKIITSFMVPQKIIFAYNKYNIKDVARSYS